MDEVWTITESQFLNTLEIYPCIASVYGTGEVLLRHARLIAAAPTMYAYIEKMANAGWGEAQDIRALINAEGREP